MILLALPLSFFIAGCKKEERQEAAKPRLQKSAEVARMAVNFNHQLDEYEPKKKSYKFLILFKNYGKFTALERAIQDQQRCFYISL